MDPGSSKIKYILSGDGAGTIFVINDKTGDIHAMKRLDREEKAEYTLTAQAVDRDTNKPLEPPSEFIIKVQDINDNPPEFVDGPYHATVPEMSLVGMYDRMRFPHFFTEHFDPSCFYISGFVFERAFFSKQLFFWPSER